MKDKEYIRYYELFTEDGPLYLYEMYKECPEKPFNTEIPEIYEFFTQESATRGYETISFLDGQAVFKREDKNSEGITTKHYYLPLLPYEFLGKVMPYIDSEEKTDEKAKEVMKILEARKLGTQLGKIVVDPPRIRDEQKNKIAEKALRPYLKK